ncbi:MAG: GNAT family N-acetyltransferase [Gemmatimonadetes bacterium]|jgi:diamine N-acetyltransferase|nr:GNAT family N-acetyltransferase [Gemmatimonadota bacterium]
MDRTVTLREVTRENIRDVLALKVSQAQEHLVPTVGDMIARATVEESAWFRAIYADDTPVGFLKVWEANAEEPDLWGLLVDAAHQGRGYARAAVELAIKEIKARNSMAKRLCVGFLAEEGARAFYEKLGFVVEREQAFDGWVESIAYRRLQ